MAGRLILRSTPMPGPHQARAVKDRDSASIGRTPPPETSEPAGSRGLPDSAASVAGNDPAPAACARIAAEPATAPPPGGSDGNCDGNPAAAADATRNLAA